MCIMKTNLFRVVSFQMCLKFLPIDLMSFVPSSVIMNLLWTLIEVILYLLLYLL